MRKPGALVAAGLFRLADVRRDEEIVRLAFGDEIQQIEELGEADCG